MHNYAVINATESLRAALTEAETGIRGYVITQDTRFLKPYNDAVKNIPALFKELRDLIKDHPEQHQKLDTLDELIGTKTSLIAIGRANFEASGFKITDEMKGRRQSSLDNMDSIRLYLSKIDNTEKELIQSRQARLSGLLKVAKAMAIISLAILLISLFYSLITFNLENKAREDADKRADKYRGDLETNINELKEKNAELKELRDMEKFTSTGRLAHTIAHEVRNPLTNILLATEQLRQAEEKNEESPVLLDLINRNAFRINQLVSDLLNATRFTQLDFKKIEINELLNETLEMARDRIGLNKVTVKKNYSPESCEIYIDSDKMKVACLTSSSMQLKPWRMKVPF